MTEKISLRKLLHISVALDMAIPYCEAAGESEKLIELFDSFSSQIYDLVHTSSNSKESSAIEAAAELYLKSYRQKFGDISEDNAKDLVTVVCGFIWRNIRDFSPKANRIFKPVQDALKHRERLYKMDSDKSEFAKWFGLHITNMGLRVKNID